MQSKTLSLQTPGLIGSTRNIRFYQRVFDVAHEQKLAMVILKRAEIILDLMYVSVCVYVYRQQSGL